MELGIRGRRAIVNGASAGMGKAAALALAREGVDLVITARGEQRLRAAADEIVAATGGKVRAVVADHSTAEGRARILAACPAPDILIGTCSPPPMTEDYRSIDSAQWQASLETGLMSPIHFMRAVLDGMVERRWGRITDQLCGGRVTPRGGRQRDDQHHPAGHVPHRNYASVMRRMSVRWRHGSAASSLVTSPGRAS